MSEFRYYRVQHQTGVDFYRIDPDKPHGKRVRVQEDGLWVDTRHATLTDLLLDVRDNDDEAEEVPVGDVPCPLCMVVAGAVTREVVHEWDDAMVIVPRPAPVCDGHLLVIPKRHVRDVLVDVELSARVHFRALTYAAERLADRALNVATSRGKAATQTEPHLHYHLVPREFGDGLPFLWDRGVPAHLEGDSQCIYCKTVYPSTAGTREGVPTK